MDWRRNWSVLSFLSICAFLLAISALYCFILCDCCGVGTCCSCTIGTVCGGGVDTEDLDGTEGGSIMLRK